MNVLALDLGTKCGWATAEAGRIISGVDTFDVRRGESPGWRYLRFTRWLDEMALREGAPRFGVIAFEKAHQRGGAATEVAAGFATHLMAFCALHGIEHVAVHTATLKKWATGKGNASKAEMLAACARRWKRVDTDDEADALALLYHTLADLVPA